MPSTLAGDGRSCSRSSSYLTVSYRAPRASHDGGDRGPLLSCETAPADGQVPARRQLAYELRERTLGPSAMIVILVLINQVAGLVLVDPDSRSPRPGTSSNAIQAYDSKAGFWHAVARRSLPLYSRVASTSSPRLSSSSLPTRLLIIRWRRWLDRRLFELAGLIGHNHYRMIARRRGCRQPRSAHLRRTSARFIDGGQIGYLGVYTFSDPSSSRNCPRPSSRSRSCSGCLSSKT